MRTPPPPSDQQARFALEKLTQFKVPNGWQEQVASPLHPHPPPPRLSPSPASPHTLALAPRPTP